MGKSGLIQKVHCLSVYKVPITFLYGTRKEINRWLHQHDLDPLNETAAGNYRIYNDFGHSTALISLIRQGNAIYEITALLHEVIHCAVYTFAKVGIRIKDEKEEPFCYYVESIMHQCLSGLRK